MKILVTGGAGYIGSTLVPQLLHGGHLVTVIDNFMYKQTPLLDKCYSSNLTVIRGDVTNLDVIQEHLTNNDYELIIPLACLTGAPLCQEDPARSYDVIVVALEEMLDMLEKDVKIIYPTSNSGYGIGGDAHCTEESKMNPISRYGKLKCQAEQIVMQRENSIALRLATAFGVSPRMRLDLLVNDFVYRAVNDGFLVLFEGHFRRNFCHVVDISKAIIHCINNFDTMKGNVYNVGDTKANVTKIQLAEKIKEHIPNLYITETNIKEDPDKRDYVVSNKKLEDTGWYPVKTLDDGIKELIKAYQIIKRDEYANI